MKNRLSVLIAVSLAVLMVGCGNETISTDIGSSNADSTDSAVEATSEESSEGVEVDEGLLTVEITIPASLYEISDEVVTQESLEEEVKGDDGIKSVKLNDDGSVTYKVTKAKQKEMLKEMKANVDDSIQSLIDNEDMSFVSIEYNDDVTKFDCIMTNNEPNLYESFAVLTLYITGTFYNEFSGADDYDIVVDYINEASGEVIYTGSYNEWVASFDDSLE